jgi:hypothetical protein
MHPAIEALHGGKPVLISCLKVVSILAELLELGTC